MACTNLTCTRPTGTNRPQPHAEQAPDTAIIGLELALLGAVGAAAVLRAGHSDWDPALFGILLGFSIFSDLTAIETEKHLKISGSFLALVLAMVFLGGAPAAVIGVISILVGWLRWRDKPHDLLNNLVTYATFPLLCGIAFKEGVAELGLTLADPPSTSASSGSSSWRWRSTS